MAYLNKGTGLYQAESYLKKFGKLIVGTGRTKEAARIDMHEKKFNFLMAPLEISKNEKGENKYFKSPGMLLKKGADGKMHVAYSKDRAFNIFRRKGFEDSNS